MGLEGARRKVREFLQDESGAGKPPSTESTLRTLRAGVIAGGVVTGLAAIHHTPDTHRASQSEEVDRSGLERMVENIEHAPIQTFGKEHFAPEELQCLTDNVYHEARGEGATGRYAVVFSTLGRVLDKKYPKSICGVVHQPMQFSWTADQNILTQPINPREYLKVAIQVHSLMQGRDVRSASVEAGLRTGLPHGAIFYKQVNFTGSKRVEKFFARLQHVLTIGKHDFFIQKAAQERALKKKKTSNTRTALSQGLSLPVRSRQAGRNRSL